MGTRTYGRQHLLLVSMAIISVMAHTAWADGNPPYKFTVTPKVGTFSLNKAAQALRIRGAESWLFSGWYVMNKLPVEVETRSHDVVAIEFERNLDSFSYGAELLHTKNAFYAPSIASSQSEIIANFLFATLKKELITSDGVRLAAGLGGGIVSAELNGYISSEQTNAMCAQVFSSFSYHWQRYKVSAEYRYVLTPSKVDFDRAHTTGQTNNVSGSLDLSGRGFNLGFGVSF